MRQAGRYMKEYRELRKRYSILQIAKTPELAAQVTLQPIARLPVDAAILFSDLLIPAEPFGIRLKFDPGPVIGNPVSSLADVRRLKDYDPREDLGFVMEAIRLVRRELGGRVPLIGFAGAPFTLASYLIEGGSSGRFLKTKALMNENPRAWDLLMRKIRRVTAEYLQAQIDAGVQAVQLFDSWVGALSPAQYREKVLPHSAWVLARLKTSGVPVIHFGTQTAGFLEDFASAGGDVIGVDWRIDLASARRLIGTGRALQGNLDPVLLMASRPVLRRAVRDILAQGGRKGFVFNLGHGILPETPFDNVRAVVDWVHEYSHG